MRYSSGLLLILLPPFESEIADLPQVTAASGSGRMLFVDPATGAVSVAGPTLEESDPREPGAPSSGGTSAGGLQHACTARSNTRLSTRLFPVVRGLRLFPHGISFSGSRA